MNYDVTITRSGMNAIFDLKGKSNAVASWIKGAAPALPEGPNSKSVDGDIAVYAIGRDHWILRAPIEQEDALREALKPETCPSDISIVRISDALTFFRVTGPEATEVMSIACTIDLHPSVFGWDMVTNTECFGQKVLLQRVEDGFEFAVEQSYGNMMQDYLARAVG